MDKARISSSVESWTDTGPEWHFKAVASGVCRLAVQAF